MVTAVRTILKQRRDRRRATGLEEDARRAADALKLVNAVRGPDAQLTELHPVDVVSVLANPDWVELVRSTEEMQAVVDARAAAVGAARSRTIDSKED